MINIQRMESQRHLKYVERLKVESEQLKFVGTIEEILSGLEPECEAHVILNDNEVVGFFLLDLGFAKRYGFAESDCVGLRAFFIDHRHQGKRYGTKAIEQLRHHVKKYYPKTSSIYLTVNCKNPVARSCYLKAGFEDTAELYLGGAAGPQHIMRLMI